MAKSIFEIFKAPNLKTRWENNAQERTPYYGEALFKAKKQLGIEINQITGKKPKVRALNLSSFDAKVIPLSREAFNKISTEMPFFKNSYNINEKQRQELNKVLAGGNQAYIDPIVNEIYDDQANLLANADVTREMMRMMVLTTGTLAFANNGQAVAFDYELANKKSANWSDTKTADPVADIEALLDAVEQASGVRPTRIMMNSVTLNNLRKVDSVRLAILKEATNEFVSKKQVVTYLETELEVTIVAYNKGYTDPETGNFVKFVPDNTISVYPEGYLGDGVFGTTPEESDLMTGTDAEVAITDTGVAITVTKLTDPVNVDTKVSMIYLPTLYTDAIGILTVTMA